MTHNWEDFGELHLPATLLCRNTHQEVTATGKCFGFITDKSVGVLDPGPLPPYCLNLPQNPAQYHPQNRGSGSPYFTGTFP